MRPLILIGAAFGLFAYALNSRAASMPSYQGDYSIAPGEIYPPESPGYAPDYFADDFTEYFADDWTVYDPVADGQEYFPDDPIYDVAPENIPVNNTRQEVPISDFDFDWLEQLNENATVEPMPARNPDANVAAFLAVIRRGEGTAGQSGYRMLYGGGFFNDFSDHPANIAWGGVKLPANYCGAAGKGAGCVSTAAGAYQFLKPTWNDVSRRAGLTDFSPDSQDAGAVQLIRDRGALADVRAGRFESALKKVAAVWASLPGSPYGQPTISLSTASSVYEQNGGTFA